MHPSALRPWHVLRRGGSHDVKSYAESVEGPYRSLLDDAEAEKFWACR